MRRIALRVAWTVLLPMTVTGCATTVAVKGRFPARVAAAAELRKTAVGSFAGPNAGDFATALESEIISVRFDDAPYFSAVDTGKHYGLPDSQSAAAYGRQVGAQGVFFGRVDLPAIRQEGYSGLGMRCVATNANGGCVKSALVAVPCTRRTLTLQVTPSMVNVANGQVVYSSAKVASFNASWCEGENPPTDDNGLYAAARNNIIGQIRLDVAPYNAVLNATIKDSADGLAQDSAAEFNAAVAAAKKTDMGEACRQWNEVDKASPDHVWTVYNLGVCAESTGDYAGALSRYQRARILASKPDNDIVASLDRAQKLVDANQSLAQIEKKRQAEAAEAKRQAEAQERERQVQAKAAAATQAAQAKAAAAARAARHTQLVAEYGAANAALIESGQVKPGMTTAAVRAARGAPVSVVKIPGGDEMWRYGADNVTFSKGKVTYVGR